MEEFEVWIQDVMYFMMMSKLNEKDGIVHSSGKMLFRIMRENNIDFRAMHDHGIEPWAVPDEIRNSEMYLTPRGLKESKLWSEVS